MRTSFRPTYSQTAWQMHVEIVGVMCGESAGSTDAMCVVQTP